MQSKCLNCGKKNTPVESFDHQKEFFIHYHYLCSCGMKWGVNKELRKPKPIPQITLEEKIRAEVIKMKKEGLI